MNFKTLFKTLKSSFLKDSPDIANNNNADDVYEAVQLPKKLPIFSQRITKLFNLFKTPKTSKEEEGPVVKGGGYDDVLSGSIEPNKFTKSTTKLSHIELKAALDSLEDAFKHDDEAITPAIKTSSELETNITLLETKYKTITPEEGSENPNVKTPRPPLARAPSQSQSNVLDGA